MNIHAIKYDYKMKRPKNEDFNQWLDAYLEENKKGVNDDLIDAAEKAIDTIKVMNLVITQQGYPEQTSVIEMLELAIKKAKQ